MSNATFSIINESAVTEEDINNHLIRVFSLMFLGLGLTTLTIFGMAYSLVNDTFLSGFFMFAINAYPVIVVAELVLVIYFSSRITKLSTTAAYVVFFTYAILNGLTFGIVVISFAATSGFATVGMAFAATGLSFAILAIYGKVTKADLTKMGSYLTVGLIMIIITTILNAFVFRSTMVDTMITYIGLVVFMGLTAYDVQNIKNTYIVLANLGDKDLNSKAAIMGALTLYLDFINMFYYILRMLSNNNNDN